MRQQVLRTLQSCLNLEHLCSVQRTPQVCPQTALFGSPLICHVLHLLRCVTAPFSISLISPVSLSCVVFYSLPEFRLSPLSTNAFAAKLVGWIDRATTFRSFILVVKTPFKPTVIRDQTRSTDLFVHCENPCPLVVCTCDNRGPNAPLYCGGRLPAFPNSQFDGLLTLH